MRKVVFCIADGMADVPALCADGITPLQAAYTPNMDSMTRHSVAGLCCTIPQSLPPDSDVGNMALLGYDPVRYHPGRGPIEARALGIACSAADLIWRLSLVCVDGAGNEAVMQDACGGGISSEQADALLAVLQTQLCASDDAIFTLHKNEYYRHLLVQAQGVGALASSTIYPGPHVLLGERIESYLAAYPAALRTFMEQAGALVSAASCPPNAVWLWGQGPVLQLPLFQEIHGLHAGMIAGVSLLRGLGNAAGMYVEDDASFTGLPDTDMAAKAAAAIRFLHDGGDIAFLHVEAPDHCAHAGDALGKMVAIEAFDREILGPLLAKLPDAVFVVTCDHLTSSQTRAHERGPVPFLLYRNDIPARKSPAHFSEQACRGLVEVLSGPELLAFAKQYAG